MKWNWAWYKDSISFDDNYYAKHASLRKYHYQIFIFMIKPRILDGVKIFLIDLL